MNQLFYLSEDEVQSQLAAKCNLFVHAGLETLQYAVVDTVRDQLKTLAEYEIPQGLGPQELISAIRQLPESSSMFKFPFNQVKISFDTFSFTFVPAALYAEEDRSSYGRFMGSQGESDLLTSDIQSAGIKNLAILNPEVRSALSLIFQKPKFFNQAHPFIEGSMKSADHKEEAMLFLDFHGQHIQVAFLKNGKLGFYNIFDCVNADEFNYFLLNTASALDIDLRMISVYLSGKISGNDDNFQRLQKYTGNILFANATQLFRHSEVFEAVPAHRFVPLLSLDLCE